VQQILLAKSHHLAHRTGPRTKKKFLQFRLVLRAQIPPTKSQANAQCSGNLRQRLGFTRVSISPKRTPFQLIQHFGADINLVLLGKFIPQIFRQLESLKATQVLYGLE